RARGIRTSLGVPVDKHSSIHCPCRGPRDTIDLQPRFFEQAIQGAPGKGAVGPASLQREIDEDTITLGGRRLAGCHWRRLSHTENRRAPRGERDHGSARKFGPARSLSRQANHSAFVCLGLGVLGFYFNVPIDQNAPYSCER